MVILHEVPVLVSNIFSNVHPLFGEIPILTDLFSTGLKTTTWICFQFQLLQDLLTEVRVIHCLGNAIRPFAANGMCLLD